MQIEPLTLASLTPMQRPPQRAEANGHTVNRILLLQPAILRPKQHTCSSPNSSRYVFSAGYEGHWVCWPWRIQRQNPLVPTLHGADATAPVGLFQLCKVPSRGVQSSKRRPFNSYPFLLPSHL